MTTSLIKKKLAKFRKRMSILHKTQQSVKLYKLYHADCLDQLKLMPDNSVDAIVTDPPYGLGKEPDPLVMLTAWINGEDYTPKGKSGFMGKKWDSFVPQPILWKEALRVLKPGGHLLSFFGTRTFDLGVLSLRLAGFEIRDTVMWCYSSGFPKSLNVGKAIDKSGLVKNKSGLSIKDLAIEIRNARIAAGISLKEMSSWFSYREVVKNWERTDKGFRSPTEKDCKLLIKRISLSPKWLEMVRGDDARQKSNGKTDRRGDNTIYALAHSGSHYESSTDLAKQWENWGTALKPAVEPIIVCRKPLEGTVANNVLKYGTGALNIDRCRIATTGEKLGGGDQSKATRTKADGWDRPWMNNKEAVKARADRCNANVTKSEQLGRWPANLIHDGSEEVNQVFDSFGVKKSGANNIRRQAEGSFGAGDVKHGKLGKAGDVQTSYGDSGSISRFFYCAKVSSKERHEGLNNPGKQFEHGETLRKVENKSKEHKGNFHPTVKPIKLMSYLCRLVTPPNGVVLDPFMGSGSTGKAALLEGFRFIGIEREADYFKIAQQRLAHSVESTPVKKSTPQKSKGTTPQKSKGTTPQKSKGTTPQKSKGTTPQKSKGTTPQKSKGTTPQKSKGKGLFN